MSLQHRPKSEVPEETEEVTRAAFPKGNIYIRMRDKLGVFFSDEQFASLFSQRGQPAISPWRLALVSVMQFVENLSDRQAAEAVRARIDWKYALGLELTDPGFDFTVLSEFRQRLLDGEMEQQLLDKMLAVLAEHKLLKEQGKQRTDSSHVIAHVRALNRLESIGEMIRHALNSVAVVAPDWLRQVAPPEWYERYSERVEEYRLPRKKQERHALAETIGADGIHLLTSIYESDSHKWLRELPAVELLRQAWVHQFYYIEGVLRLRVAKDLPPSSIRFDSPYDPEAHYATKRSMHWTGYKVHLTETCDDEAPHLITHVETTIGPQSDADMTVPIHEALAEKGILPETHLADAGYIDAEQIVASQSELGVNLMGPVRPDVSWQAQEGTGYTIRDFHVDWNAQTVTCPRGETATYWKLLEDRWRNEIIRIRFSNSSCRQCEVRALCTRDSTESRFLTFRPQAQHEALVKRREEQETEEWQEQYAKRAGVEGTISQGVRGFGLRQCRYIGLAKTHLQHILTVAAINLARLDAWHTGKKRAHTRVSHFAALRPAPA